MFKDNKETATAFVVGILIVLSLLMVVKVITNSNIHKADFKDTQKSYLSNPQSQQSQIFGFIK